MVRFAFVPGGPFVNSLWTAAALFEDTALIVAVLFLNLLVTFAPRALLAVVNTNVLLVVLTVKEIR